MEIKNKKNSLFLQFETAIFLLIFCSFKSQPGQAAITFKAEIRKNFNYQIKSFDSKTLAPHQIR